MIDILILKRLLWLVIAVLVAEIALVAFQLMRTATQVRGLRKRKEWAHLVAAGTDSLWHAPDTTEIPHDNAGNLIRYGRELVEHTAVYLGPKGKIASMSNGMNCRNCHLHAGTKPYAANYSAVASTYPKFRHRSGTVEGFEKRINDCFERSLNGKPLPDTSREMKAMVAYLKWVGKDVKRGSYPEGAGLMQLDYLERAADPVSGKHHYMTYCASCHGANGQGVKHNNQAEWQYPPLWGGESYNTGAGLYRISKFAAFIRANMPYGARYDSPVLSVEEAWDIAGYVNSMPRPHREFPQDWPDVANKPVDHPFGPYSDRFSETAHKYGPFTPMLNSKNN